MNKEELLQELQQLYMYVSPIDFPADQIPGISGLYVVDVLKQVDEATAVKKIVKFYVRDMNMPTEEVIFDGWNPLVPAQTTFAEEVRAYVENLIRDGIYDYVALEDVNEETQRAFAWAYKITETGTLEEKAIILIKDEAGKITYKEATVV